MQTNMSYTQFEDAAKKAGLYDTFSQGDLELARKDPAAGMKILGYKTDYKNATTDEARALANAGAESVRIGAGYSGGADGGGYKTMSAVPSSFGYTYEDFVKKAQESGVYGQFSEADLALAKRNADAGLSLVDGKVRYAAATTDEERAAINQEMEAIRSSYGGYTGGADGAGFIKNPLSPKDFTYKEAPAYENAYADDIADLYGQIKNYKDFSYDAETDPLYAQHKKQYLREGERASADALGVAAAATGGIPSSYAATAAAQAGNYYAAQLTDKIPELYEAAYNRYMKEYAMLGDKLKTAQGLENTEYAKHLDDYTKWQNDRTFGYGQHIDEINNQKVGREEALKMAILGTEMGDYNGLRELGINMDNTPMEYEEMYKEREYADGRQDTAWQKGIAEYEKKVTLAELAKTAGDVETYNKIMKELLGSSFTPATEFGTNEKSIDKKEEGIDTVIPIIDEDNVPVYTHTGDVRVAYPSGYINDEDDYNALLERYGEEQLKAAGVTKGEPPYKTYEEAVRHLKDNGKVGEAGTVSTRAEWEKHKSEHISYEKYLEAKVNAIMGK